MGSHQKPLTDKITLEEKALFQNAMQQGKFLSSSKHHPITPRQSIQFQCEDLSDSEKHRFTPNETIFFKRAGCQNRTLQKLQSGKFPIQMTLDLHGMTCDDAKEAITRFIQNAYQNHTKTIKIIHGKGLILKNHAYHWLTQMSIVLAICSALPKDGGTGAVYVLLKSS